jgi:hypothetical protein
MTKCFALLSVVFGVALNQSHGVAPQTPAVVAWAFSSSDSIRMRNTFASIVQADGSILNAHTIYSADELADLEVPVLVVGAADSIRVTFEPSADSVRVTPVRRGARLSRQATPAQFRAPEIAGLYDYLVSAKWSENHAQQLATSRMRGGEWALRLSVVAKQ